MSYGEYRGYMYTFIFFIFRGYIAFIMSVQVCSMCEKPIKNESYEFWTLAD